LTLAGRALTIGAGHLRRAARKETTMDAYKTHGAFSWNELMTSDASAAQRFYGALLGWTFDTSEMGQGPYHLIRIGDTSIGGIMGPLPDAPPQPPAWGPYITVSDIEQTVAACQTLGGRLCAGPFDVPGVGRMAVLQDPQGAVFNAITYQAEGG
jgi:uncharacterized protein